MTASRWCWRCARRRLWVQFLERHGLLCIQCHEPCRQFVRYGSWRRGISFPVHERCR